MTEFTAQDIQFMRRALEVAKSGIGLTGIAPSIGSVLVKNGRIIGEGRTQNGGVPHAEEVALEDCRERGFDPEGCSVYATLEPCATPDLGAGDCCTSLLIDAKVKEVYMSVLDPDHKTNGNGRKRLEAAGIQTYLGLLADEAYAQNVGFYESRGIDLSYLKKSAAP